MGGCAQQLCGAANFLPCLDEITERAPRPIGPLVRDSNQVELSAKLPGLTGPAAGWDLTQVLLYADM